MTETEKSGFFEESDSWKDAAMFWIEEARQYAENADFWRANYEAQAKTIEELKAKNAVLSFIYAEETGRDFAADMSKAVADLEALKAENERLHEEIDRLRGPATIYRKGFGVGDGDVAILETGQ